MFAAAPRSSASWFAWRLSGPTSTLVRWRDPHRPAVRGYRSHRWPVASPSVASLAPWATHPGREAGPPRGGTHHLHGGSSSEAHLPAERPEAGEAPWLPPSHVDQGRPRRRALPPPEGPAAAVGLIW